MSEGYLLGSDIGSGSCKTLLADTKGKVVARADRSYAVRHQKPGWAEYDPEDWYAAFCETVREVINETQIDSAAILAICIVGITHDPVLLDSQGQVLRPAIHFNDQRSLPQVERLRNEQGPSIRERTTNEVSTLWTYPQLMWVREHEPQVWHKVRSLVFPKDYVRQRLTINGKALTDHIDAAGTLLFDPQARQWIADFVETLGLPMAALPAVHDPLALVAEVSMPGAEDTGIKAGTPVLVGTTDTAAEMIAAGAVAPGLGTLKLASVGRIAFVTHDPIRHRHVLNYPHLIDGLWYPGTATKYAASAFRWFRDALWRDVPDNQYETLDRAASEVRAGANGLFFLPHLMGQSAPHWNPKLTAAFIGIGHEHHIGHFTRAVLEGVALSMREALEAVNVLGLNAHETTLIGNGARSPLWSQIMADVMNLTISVPAERDAAYGAVLMAGASLGIFAHNFSDVSSMISVEARCEPDPDRAAVYDEIFEAYCLVNRALLEVADELYRHQQTIYSLTQTFEG